MANKTSTKPHIILNNGVSPWATLEDVKFLLQPADILEVQRHGYRQYVMFIRYDRSSGRGICVYITQRNLRGYKVINYLDRVVVSGTQCRINNKTIEAEMQKVRPMSLVDQLGAALDGFSNKEDANFVEIDFPDYDPLTNNDQVNVTKWKYGRNVSNVVDRVAKAVVISAFMVATGIMASIKDIHKRGDDSQRGHI